MLYTNGPDTARLTTWSGNVENPTGPFGVKVRGSLGFVRVNRGVMRGVTSPVHLTKTRLQLAMGLIKAGGVNVANVCNTGTPH